MVMRQVLRQAMQNPEEWVVSLEYCDSKGVRTRRIVSPIRFLGGDRFLALCLCRAEPRQFYLDRCGDFHLQPAAEFVMPVAM